MCERLLSKMYSGIATGLFAIRNCNKTTNGDVGRLPVTVGQTASVLKAGAQYNNALSRQAKVVINTCEQIAKTDKLFNGVSKIVKFASDNVNPLIAASSGVKVILADDKKSAFLTEGGCIAGMFLGEGWMKKNLEGLLTSMKITGKWAPVVKGVLFVAGSIGASTLGSKIGENIAEQLKTPEQSIKEELERKSYPKSISVKA